MTLTSSQKGKIVEYYVASTLMAASDGRLSPFVPISDDHGVDLIIMDKESGKSASVQVKSWSAKSTRNTVQFDIRKATYSDDDRSLLLAVVLDPLTLTMETSWLLQMSKIPSLAIDKKEKYALSPNRRKSSEDKYSQYRHETPTALTEAMINTLS